MKCRSHTASVQCLSNIPESLAFIGRQEMQSGEKPECTQNRVKFVINITASFLCIQSITLWTMQKTIQAELYPYTILPWVQFYKVNPTYHLANAKMAVTFLHSFNTNSCHFLPPLNAHLTSPRADSAWDWLSSEKSKYIPCMIEEKPSTVVLNVLAGFLAYTRWATTSAVPVFDKGH